MLHAYLFAKFLASVASKCHCLAAVLSTSHVHDMLGVKVVITSSLVLFEGSIICD